MSKPIKKLTRIPEILYEAPDYPGQKTSPIPHFILNPGEESPVVFFIFEYRDTGELEDDGRGKMERVMDGPYAHKYYDFEYLCELLREHVPENADGVIRDIRVSMGLEPTKEQAIAKGEKILDKRVEVASAKAEEDLKQKKREIAELNKKKAK
jgi:hypothetical protein